MKTLAVGLLLRLLLAFVTPLNVDVNQYAISADAVLAGDNLYAVQPNYNYSPLFAYAILAPVRALSGPAFPFAVRAVIIAGDLLTALAVGRLAGRRAFAAYWLNPGVACIVAWWGQFDTLALACTLWACWYARRFSLSTSSSFWRRSSSSSVTVHDAA